MIVKIFTDDDGEKYEETPWHLVHDYAEGQRTVCSGEVFGEGESIATFQTKEKGKVTCRKCIEVVKWFKKINLNTSL